MIWLEMGALFILTVILIAVWKRYSCPNCKKWKLYRYSHFANGGGLGPAGLVQEEWCSGCGRRTGRVKLDDGRIYENESTTERKAPALFAGRLWIKH